MASTGQETPQSAQLMQPLLVISTFFHDKAQNFITVQPGQFCIFFPEDGHQPCIAEGQFHKIIVKVKL